MLEALKEAKKADQVGEVPIGAVIVKDDKIIGRGHNLTETLKDPTKHAEMVAIEQALKNTDGFRLKDCQMYVTLEPCSMCAGAIVLTRINKLYIGAMDPKSGACGSVLNVLQQEKLNHYVEIESKVYEEQCSAILKEFFHKLRLAK